MPMIDDAGIGLFAIESLLVRDIGAIFGGGNSATPVPRNSGRVNIACLLCNVIAHQQAVNVVYRFRRHFCMASRLVASFVRKVAALLIF